MAAVVEVGADGEGTPSGGAHEVAEIHIAKRDLAGRGVSIERAAERVGGAVELREIITSENAGAGIAGGGADDARPFIASHFDVHFVVLEGGDTAIEKFELVLRGHPGNEVEDGFERAVTGMARAREAGGVGELGPLEAASR